MYIIADVEWVQNKLNKRSPTQLSAVRVDENWEIVNDFSSYIKPFDHTFHDWNHIAYTGGKVVDFLNAHHCYDVFSAFNEWVGNDTICWWHKSSPQIHTLINRAVLKVASPKDPIILNEYMPGFLDGQDCVKGDPYKLARARGISVPDEQHNSWNDVIAILQLFRGIGFPQEALLLPPTKPTPKPTRRANENLKYQYDVGAGLLHKNGCTLLPNYGEILGFATLNTPLKKNFKFCYCVLEDIMNAKRKKIADEIERSQYSYIYAKNSKVFHRRDCGLLYNADKIMGTVKYDTVVSKGLRPCKKCTPTPSDQYRPEVLAQKVATMSTPTLAKHGLTRSELAAVARHEQAKKERLSEASRTDMSRLERKDMLTLTQPGLVFFVAKGYLNFHTRKCTRLEGLSDFIGFDTFAHAKNAGFTPCKSCKPTKKMDIVTSIPIDNMVRETETVDDLRELCDRYGYKHILRNEDFEVMTPSENGRSTRTPAL